jgi:hypothetical protein
MIWIAGGCEARRQSSLGGMLRRPEGHASCLDRPSRTWLLRCLGCVLPWIRDKAGVEIAMSRDCAGAPVVGLECRGCNADANARRQKQSNAKKKPRSQLSDAAMLCYAIAVGTITTENPMAGPSIKVVGWNRRNWTEMLRVAGGQALERTKWVVSRRDVPSLDELARMRPCPIVYWGPLLSNSSLRFPGNGARPGCCPAPAPLPRMPIERSAVGAVGGWSVWCLSARYLQPVDEFSGPKRIFRSFF